MMHWPIGIFSLVLIKKTHLLCATVFKEMFIGNVPCFMSSTEHSSYAILCSLHSVIK